jgi:tetratricopeptide (TPR) repeat protein
MLYALGDVDDAARAARRAANSGIDPTASDGLASRLLRLSGEIAWHNNDLNAAESALETAYHMDPTVIGNGERFARLLASQGRLREALDVIDDALRYLPGDRFLETARDEFTRRIAHDG